MTVDVHVAACSHAAARHAVERWHYSGQMPSGKLVRFGVWEDRRFVGAVIFGRGATDRLGRPFDLTQTEACELVRVALREHTAPVSQIVAQSLRRLRGRSPGLRAAISFADPRHGHVGVIYQAGNWIYTGPSQRTTEYIVHGEIMHNRSISSLISSRPGTYPPRGDRQAWLRKYVDPAARRITSTPKHRYVYPLDRAARRRLLPFAKPYPTADEVSTVRHPASGGEGQVRPLPSAPHADDRAD